MYYYGYNNYGNYSTPCMPQQGFAGYTTGGYGLGAALWIVLFILLVIIIVPGWSGNIVD